MNNDRIVCCDGIDDGDVRDGEVVNGKYGAAGQVVGAWVVLKWLDATHRHCVAKCKLCDEVLKNVSLGSLYRGRRGHVCKPTRARLVRWAKWPKQREVVAAWAKKQDVHAIARKFDIKEASVRRYIGLARERRELLER